MKKLLVVVFIIYLAVLIKLILFKGTLFYTIVPVAEDYRTETANKSYRNYNLIPFKTIGNFLSSGEMTSTSVKVYNILGNIALFIPFGFLVPLVFSRANKWHKVVAVSAATSCLFEVYQYLSATGNLDVDDVILNSLGGLVGFVCLAMVREVKSLRLTAAR